MNPREDGAKRIVPATLVKVLTHRRDDRGMRLEEFTSRCVRRGEVHELVSTDQAGSPPGARIDRVGFLGFAEIDGAGVIDRGDEVWADGRRVGTVLGFDACHFPNHYNVLIAVDSLVTGPELGLRPEVSVVFRQRRAAPPTDPAGRPPAYATGEPPAHASTQPPAHASTQPPAHASTEPSVDRSTELPARTGS
ncbi:DUF6917 domain-containing protein [Streptomyces sp. NPDC059477]|uniref:DUF6917 domain-containing protein n=1 Tax=Streptomyces sp. NPDC059477 TaxID=3346847 RepID=UPI0036897C96